MRDESNFAKEAQKILEKVSKSKTNNEKPSKNNKQKKRWVRLSSWSEEILQVTSGDSFNEDNNDDFYAVYKGYFSAKKKFQTLLYSVHWQKKKEKCDHNDDHLHCVKCCVRHP